MRKITFACLTATLALAVSAQAAVWTGQGTNANWSNSGNWDAAGPAGSQASGGSKFDQAVFGTRAANTFDPVHNVSDSNEVAGLNFTGDWDLSLFRDLRLRQNGRGIDVNVAGADVNVTISTGNGKKLLWFDSPTNTIATGDTVTQNVGWEALTDNQDHTFNGGGTYIFNGSFASGSKEKDSEFDVEGNTTLVANTLLRLGNGNSAEAIDINVGSTLAGTGGVQAGGAGGTRRATIDGTLTPGWGGTPFDTFAFTNISRVDLNGTFLIDIDAAGNSDGLAGNDVRLGANSVVNVSGISGADAYIIASYTSLTGMFDEANSILPDGYVIDYNYEGNNQIALVIPEPASMVLFAGGMCLLARRRRA